MGKLQFDEANDLLTLFTKWLHLCCSLVLFFYFLFFGFLSALISSLYNILFYIFRPWYCSWSDKSSSLRHPLSFSLSHQYCSPVYIQIYIFFLLFFFFWLDNMKVHKFYLFISSFLLRAGMQAVYLIFPFNLTENCSDMQFEGHPNEKVSLHLLSLLFSASNFSMSPIRIIYMVLFFSISSIMLMVILLYISVTALGIFFCIRVLRHYIYVLIDN